MQDSHAHHPERGPAVGTDDKGNPIPATEFVQTELEGKVSVASGKVVRAKDAKISSKSGQGQTVSVVGARVLEAESKAK